MTSVFELQIGLSWLFQPVDVGPEHRWQNRNYRLGRDFGQQRRLLTRQRPQRKSIIFAFVRELPPSFGAFRTIDEVNRWPTIVSQADGSTWLNYCQSVLTCKGV